MGQANPHRAWARPGFAMHSCHMADNLKKDKKFEWDARHGREYDYLLRHIASGASLAPFSFSRDVHIRCDASSRGSGCKLFQMCNHRAYHRTTVGM